MHIVNVNAFNFGFPICIPASVSPTHDGHDEDEYDDIIIQSGLSIAAFTNNDLEAAVKLPHHMMDLEFELQLEEDSEWKGQTLGRNASTQDEEDWREIIDKMIENDSMPRHVYADKKFLGGKQFQRATELLKAAMAEAFPDITEMKEFVASGAGYLQGGLQRENWERGESS